MVKAATTIKAINTMLAKSNNIKSSLWDKKTNRANVQVKNSIGLVFFNLQS